MSKRGMPLAPPSDWLAVCFAACFPPPRVSGGGEHTGKSKGRKRKERGKKKKGGYKKEESFWTLEGGGF